ncbi:helix-turn-helix domain-containing protein [Thermococcus aggregans]|uniref:Helix-turn-helix domain-containing protein n=1 Tax=Thermococcus aggregans TaxID=110163 RepID=A0A9E7MWD9_THEAG|nr:helix-turn-helix domain-containing protein [Thermococcus aggregans]USS40040.1 helix-turn-helix domain-containing protein [Thermococcus aggregans]
MNMNTEEIVEIGVRQQGWRSSLTTTLLDSKIEKISFFFKDILAFSTQYVLNAPPRCIYEFLNQDGNVIDYHVIEVSENMSFVVTWEKLEHLTPYFVEAGFYPLYPPVVEKGITKWLLATRPSLTSFSKLFELLEKANVNIVYINRMEIQEAKKEILTYVCKANIFIDLPILSEIEEKILKKCLDEGYYEFPRKKSLRDISKALNMSPSTFSYTLRKAEKKIISWVLNSKFYKKQP